MTDCLTGWTPIRVSWPAGEPQVEWCHTEGTRFDDPFFDQTIERCLRHPFRLLFRRETPLRELPAWAAGHRGLEPSGFVFHLSRCGSTLLAQMFATRTDTHVVSEAGPLDTVLRARVSDDVRATWLRAMVTALGQPASPAERHYVVKFDAWSALDLPLVRRAFPDVPWVFLYREPVEVLVSHSRRRGYHMLPSMLGAERLGLDAATISGLTLDEYGGAVLAAICSAALEAAAGDDRALLVEYGELPAAAVDRVADHFGIPVDESDRSAMWAAATRDAKNHVVPFADDRAAKQQAASADLRAAAQRVEPWYRRLEACRMARP